jgi:hypothetical protein
MALWLRGGAAHQRNRCANGVGLALYRLDGAARSLLPAAAGLTIGLAVAWARLAISNHFWLMKHNDLGRQGLIGLGHRLDSRMWHRVRILNRTHILK